MPRLFRPSRLFRVVSAVTAVALLAAGCSSTGGPPTPDARSTPQAVDRPQRYVALGDSYTAGPLVPETDLADGCLRSDHNYPSLLADRLDLRLLDVSCSGADSRDLLRPQRTVRDSAVPPQLRAVDRRTDLVTLGIGGNDLHLFSTLVRTCLSLREEEPQGSPCADSDLGRDLVGSMPRIRDNVTRALGLVQERAPRAKVLLVGYLRIAPSSGSCPGRLPLADGDVTFGDRVIRRLGVELGRAADEAGVPYVDMYAASQGHDVCSEDPWVQGRKSQPGVAAAFHPRLAGMQAVADELEVLLR